jgi:DNA-binding MarR family transcriptional regulator
MRPMRRDRGHRTAGRYLGGLHRFSRRYYGIEMEQLDLPPVAFPLLMRLLHRDDVSQEDLVNDFLVDKGTVARTLANLEESGLVTRVIDEDDRRVKRVTVTEKARSLEPELKAVARRWDGRLTAGFTDEERELMLSFLARMMDNAKLYWRELCETEDRREA